MDLNFFNPCFKGKGEQLVFGFQNFPLLQETNLTRLRRLFSYFFAFLVLFNVLGYYGLFVGLQYQNTKKMTERFDAGAYGEEELITLKIPMTVPYMTENSDFQRVDGSITYEGQVYRMVKQKVTPDAVYIICTKDLNGTQIENALTDYVKTFADNPTDSKSSSKIQINFIKEYVAGNFIIENPSLGWQREVVKNTTYAFFVDSFNSSIVHPPERA